MKILINQLDEHNENNIIITNKFKPNKVIFLVKKNKDELMNSIKNYYKRNLNNIELIDIEIFEGDFNSLDKLINKYKNDEIILNLTGGERINSLIFLEFIKKYNLKGIYLDIKNKKSYIFEDSIKVLEEDFEDLNILDVISASGGDILEDSSVMSNKEELIYLSKIIYNNLDIWSKNKMKLYDQEIFKHDCITPDKVYINKQKLNSLELKLIYKVLKKLRDLNQIKYYEKDTIIDVNLLNNYIKGFIFKSGTWLEIATNNLIGSIHEVDEARNGVIFLWQNDNKYIKNEVDVVAIKDCVPICISCKDTEKYNEVALNELDIYANRIGGENAYKILVATREPLKGTIKTRASEMGINIVIFDGDEKKFINNIKNIINTK